MHPKIICFGETLFDVLPDGAVPGGAPMNVAIHLAYNGHAPLLISRVGKDTFGRELTGFLESKGLSTASLQQDQTHQTGMVEANVSNKLHVTYTIVEPVAWDFIHYDEQLAKSIRKSEVFIYGSLAARHKTTRETLMNYLPLATGLKVFDVNLRPPHYTPEGVMQLLEQAAIVKMNHQELVEILSWFGMNLEEKEGMEYLLKRFNKQLLLVTRGENGASLITREGYAEHPGFQVTVEDTIGSGDAFLAMFLHRYLQRMLIPEALSYACAAGAYVATQRGATPKVPETFVHALMKSAIHS
jgi:fructokinase